VLICPFCRASNPEDRETCAQCGRDLRQAVQPLPSTVPHEPPSDIEPPPPVKSGPRWGRIVALGVVVLLLAGGGTWLSVRPQPCDGKYTSTQFGYCVTVPQGWRASVAHIGPTDVDQYVALPATTIVMSIPLRSGVSLAQYAGAAQDQDKSKGLTAGPPVMTEVGGASALQWEISKKNGRFKGVEVVTVHDDVGWTIQLNDDEATIGSHLDQFRSMLSSFHFN
jgi:hypothetical protein